MIKTVKITSLRLYAGLKAGLSQKTAIVDLEVNPGIEEWRAGVIGLPERIRTLRPGEPLYGVNAADWPGAFIAEGSETADFAQWLVALTVALQRWARDPVYQGLVLVGQGRRIRLALPWEREAVLTGALQMALNHLLLWSQPEATQVQLTHTARSLHAWLDQVQAGGLSPNTHRFAMAAAQRSIPVSAINGILSIGWGCQSERLDSSFTGKTGNIAARIARYKPFASQMLHGAGLPIPPTALVADWETALAVAAKLGWPVVVKPSNRDQGEGVVPGIRDEVLLRKAYAAAARLSPGAVIVEKYVEGDDHRLLVVGGRLLIATRRIPAGVSGDGVETVSRLVEVVNADPRRGNSKRSLMMRLRLDEEALACLTEQGLAPESIPAAGRFVRLRRTANISTGGTAEDVTGCIHPDNRFLAERAARVIGLDIAGVDFLCPDISRSWREVGGAICEVNAQPGFRPHWLSDPGRDINGEIIDWLFRDKPARIPTAAITGTNGKSTVARMLHHIWLTSGITAGVCTTNGVWIGEELVSDKNLSGYPGGRILLEDPAVEAAVIELPRKGLILFGHPCDRYDVGALLNVQDDHIGVDGIDSMEQMAELKAEVLERATAAVVINADDPLCLAMRTRAGTQRQILVVRDSSNPAVEEHRAIGGEAVFISSHHSTPWIVLAEGATETLLLPLHDIPATMNGLLRFNEVNALFAAALAWAQGVPPATIRTALGSFANTPECNPGRYNIIEGFPFKVLLDFGHNPDGVREICSVVSNLEVTGKRRLLSIKLGNRHKAHFIQLAPLLAKTFDTFVIGCTANSVKKCKDYEGDDPEGAMLASSSGTLQDQGVLPENIIEERDRLNAIRAAIETAQPGDLLVLLAEPWEALPVLAAMRS
jgi:cyanophycin synthetase